MDSPPQGVFPRDPKTAAALLELALNAVLYGADPTGANDSTTAFSDFTTAVGSSGVGYIPTGTYKVTSMATFDSSATYIFAPGALLLLNGTPQQRLSYYHPAGEPYNVLRETFASGSTSSTTGTTDASSKTLTLAAAEDFAVGQGIAIQGAGAATSLSTPTMPSVTWNGTKGTTTWAYTIAAVDSLQGVTATPTSASVTDGAATLTGANYPSFTLPSTAGVTAFAVYRTTAGTTPSTTGYLGVWAPGALFQDQALAVATPPDGIPSTAPSAATAQYLLTQIASGGGTTSLTLVDAATTKVSNVNVYHDDHAALQAWLTKLDDEQAAGEIPVSAAYYVFQPLTSVGGFTELRGAGNGGNGFAETLIDARIAMGQVMTLGPSSSSDTAYGLKMSGVRINGNNLTVASSLTIQNVAWSRFERVLATGSAAAGFLLSTLVETCLFESCMGNYNGTDGWRILSTSNQVTLFECVANNNTRRGIYVDSSDGVRILACDVESNGITGDNTTMGVSIFAANKCVLENTWLERNKGLGTIVLGHAIAASIKDCSIYTETADVSGGRDINLLFQGSNEGCIIEGNRFFGTTADAIDDAVAPAVFIGTNYTTGPAIPSSAAGVQTSPAIPAASTALQNPFGFNCVVIVTGGTGVDIGLGQTSSTTATGIGSGVAVPVPRASYINLGDYTAVPSSWTWIGV